MASTGRSSAQQLFLPNHAVVRGEKSDPGGPVAFILHGILGSLGNWRSWARRFVRELPTWRAVLVDLRNHGANEPAPPPHDLEACAKDLARLARALEVQPRVVVGHSFGGKVALTYARDQAEPSLEQVWVLDSQLHGDPKEDREPASLIAHLRDMPAPFESREGMARRLTSAGFSPSVASWMTTNLERRGDGRFDWRFDLEGVVEMMRAYFATDLWPVVEDDDPYGPQLHIVRAERGDRWPDAVIERLETAAALSRRVFFHVLPDAGHWVHVDNPEGLLELVAGRLNA